MKRKFKLIALAASLFVMCAALCSCNQTEDYGDMQELTVGDGKTLRVGIISDAQLPPKENYEEGYDYNSNLKRAFTAMKNQNIEVLIFAGDLTDAGTDYAYESFMNSYNEVFGDTQVIPCFIMGNHDYWAKGSEKTLRKRFFKGTGENPFSHKVINGFHFINWSSENGSYDTCNENKDWVQGEIEKAVSSAPEKPVIVTTHLPGSNTVYGSEDWGNQGVYDALKDYPQVINFSGHSHYSLMDERSIWQGEYTAIATQSVSYIELEEGKENGTVPHDEYGNGQVSRENSIGLIMTLNEDGAEIERISIKTGEKIKESWQIPTGVDKGDFIYTTEKRQNSSEVPVFESKDVNIVQRATDIEGNSIRILNFRAAKHSDIVHSYKVVFEDSKNQKSEYLYFSDFYLLPSERKDIVSLKIPNDVKKGQYTISIYALDSFGKTSRPIQAKIVLE